MSPELLLALFATCLALSFPFSSWTLMLTAAEEHEEWQQRDRERRAEVHKEVITAALASLPPLIVDMTIDQSALARPQASKWVPSGFVPQAEPIRARGR